MNPDDSFLGTGWSFPPAFDRSTGRLETAFGVRDIEESLAILFTTPLGSRVMNPTYGCATDALVFETMDTQRIVYLENLIRTAILYHEPRIDVDRVEVRPDPAEGRLLIHIAYVVRTTNSRFNFVFPFYLEGER